MAVLQVSGGELYYEVEGVGVPVALVHGFGLDARMWDEQMPALEDIARVVRYDARGFGRSTRDAETAYSHADDLWRLLDQLEIETAVLVGLSMGGRTVVEATLAAPERLQALVLLDALLEGVPWDHESAQGMQAIGEAFRSGGPDEAKAAWFRHDFFGPAQRNPEVARRLAEMVGDYSGLSWTSPDPHEQHPNTVELLATIRTPTTVVTGELDVPCFHEMARVLAERIPGARMVTISDVGHMVNMEAPEAVNAVLREVVRVAGLPPGDSANCDEAQTGIGGLSNEQRDGAARDHC
jgi:pimeloyl-ACP methyl ester carboxylesterase